MLVIWEGEISRWESRTANRDSCVQKHEITKEIMEDHLEKYSGAILLRALNTTCW